MKVFNEKDNTRAENFSREYVFVCVRLRDCVCVCVVLWNQRVRVVYGWLLGCIVKRKKKRFEWASTGIDRVLLVTAHWRRRKSWCSSPLLSKAASSGDGNRFVFIRYFCNERRLTGWFLHSRFVFLGFVNKIFFSFLNKNQNALFSPCMRVLFLKYMYIFFRWLVLFVR